MRQQFALPVVMAAFFNAGCASAVDDSQFKITTRRASDKVEINFERDKTVISVYSPAGISQAVIEPHDKNWPDTLTLRLHLKGLEKFKVMLGTTTLEAAVSSHGDSHPSRLWLRGQEDSPLDAESEYWMAIRMFGNDGKPANTIPLIDGYFEMKLPAALFAGETRSMTIDWIDFYR